MIKLSLPLLALFISNSAQANALSHQRVEQNFPLPKGWVPNPHLVFNNAQPPVVFFDQGSSTNIELSSEIEKCRAQTSLFNIVEEKKDAIYSFELELRNEGFSALRQTMEQRGQSIYDAPIVNINCRLRSGEMAVIVAKVYPFPYYTVKISLPKAPRRDYSAFAGIDRKEQTPPPKIETAPYRPEKEQRPSSTLAGRDYQIFERLLGDKL